MKKVYARKDDDGHWYVIPYEQREEFSKMLSLCYGEDDSVYEAQAKFEEKFSKYRTGGDLNNVQLYAEL